MAKKISLGLIGILYILIMSGCDISPKIFTAPAIDTDRMCVFEDKMYSVGSFTAQN